MKGVILGGSASSGIQILNKMFELGGFQCFNQSRIFARCGIAVFDKYGTRNNNDIYQRIEEHWNKHWNKPTINVGIKRCIEVVISQEQFSIDINRIIDGVEERNKRHSLIGNYIESIFNKVSELYGKRMWCETTPGNVYDFDKILEAMPKVKIIHVYRHPYATLFSIRLGKYWGKEFKEIFPIYHHHTESGLKYAKEYGPDRIRAVKMEELISDEGIIKSLYDWIGLDYDPKAFSIDKPLWLSKYHSDRWKTELTEKDLKELESFGAKELTVKLGYDEDITS